MGDKDCNGWSDPGGKGFMVRSQSYNENSLKVCLKISCLNLFFMLLKLDLLIRFEVCGMDNFSTESLLGGTQISVGEPLMKLLAVDWLKSDQRIDHIALQSSCCVQVS
jgi:hypothetical protein